MQNKSSANPQGIDISSYQDGLDMSAVKAAGISVVYIKATENLSYVNPYMHEQYSQAKAQGLKVGFYHYFIAGFDAIKQAQHFINTIAGLTYDCLPTLDVEETGGYSATALSSAAKSCLDEIKTLSGHQPMLYTYTSFAKNSLVSSYVNAYPLWIADYNGKSSPGANPIWNAWVGFQYSDSGEIGGITVDLDEFTSAVFVEGVDDLVETTVTLNGTKISIGYLINDHNYAPVAVLAQALGLTVTWDDNTKTVNIIKP